MPRWVKTALRSTRLPSRSMFVQRRWRPGCLSRLHRQCWAGVGHSRKPHVLLSSGDVHTRFSGACEHRISVYDRCEPHRTALRPLCDPLKKVPAQGGAVGLRDDWDDTGFLAEASLMDRRSLSSGSSPEYPLLSVPTWFCTTVTASPRESVP
jgi:hypothetical protein